MKKLSIISMILISQSLLAVDCAQEFKDAMRYCDDSSNVKMIAKDYGVPTKCKVLNSPDGRSQIAYNYANSTPVVIAMKYDNYSNCNTSVARITGSTKSVFKGIGGRLLFVASKKLYVIGRNQGIHELLKNSGKSVKAQSIKGADGGQSIQVTDTDGNSFKWNNENITRKLNGDTRKARVLSF
jgi:hypothetical protein